MYFSVCAWLYVNLSNSVCVKKKKKKCVGVGPGSEHDCVLIRSQWCANFRPCWDSCRPHIPIAFPIWQLMSSQMEWVYLNWQQYTCQLNFCPSPSSPTSSPSILLSPFGTIFNHCSDLFLVPERCPVIISFCVCPRSNIEAAGSWVERERPHYRASLLL